MGGLWAEGKSEGLLDAAAASYDALCLRAWS